MLHARIGKDITHTRKAQEISNVKHKTPKLSDKSNFLRNGAFSCKIWNVMAEQPRSMIAHRNGTSKLEFKVESANDVKTLDLQSSLSDLNSTCLLLSKSDIETGFGEFGQLLRN